MTPPETPTPPQGTATDSADGLMALVQALSPEGQPAQARDQAPSEGELVALLAAARVAPSADNAQTWRFIVARDPAVCGALAEAVPEALREAFRRAGLCLAVCGIKWLVTRTRREQPFALIDVPIAVSHILLMAAEMGWSPTWTLTCDEPQVRRTLGIPEDVRVVALLAF